MPLFVGDIVAVRYVNWHPAIVVDVDYEGNGRALARSALGEPWGANVGPERLIACGRDEDCRAYLDLAIDCAASRRADDKRGGT